MSENKTKLSRGKRWALFGALLFFSFQLAIPALVVPQPASAILGFGDLTITIGDIPALIMEAIKSATKIAGDVAFKNVLRSYVNNLAYNLAVEVATGDAGQKPLFPTSPKDLLRDAADVAAGDILDSIASDWAGKSQCKGYPGTSCKTNAGCNEPVLMCPTLDAAGDCVSSVEAMNKCLAAGCVVVNCSEADLASGTGLCNYDNSALPKDDQGKLIYVETTAGAPVCESSFSLCQIGPPSVQIQLNILARKALSDQQGGQASISGRCPLTDIIDNFDDYRGAIGDSVDANKLYLVEFSKTFNPEATQLGAYLKITSEASKAGSAASQGAEVSASISGDLNPVTSLVSGAVKTPASFLRNAATDVFGKSIDAYLVYTGSVIADAVGVFTNTLASKLIERYIFGLDPATSTGGGSRGFASFFGGSSPGVTAAKFLFADLQNTNYSISGTTDILSSLSSCPDPNDPTPDTCVIDSRFRTAIDQGMTVQQAIDQGLLDATKPFGFGTSGLEPDYFNGYPYRSMLILRKYRIIPVGWELAAQYINNYASGSFSLNTMIQDYSNPESPFYLLVDPNWVLKSPEVFCKRQGSGEKIISSTAIRNEDTNLDNKIDTADAAGNIIQRQGNYCADEQLCLKKNSDGSCQKYGYCIEDKSIWQFDGTSCEAQFSSCQALTESGGGSVSLVLNTVDENGCNSENAGCQWYCEDFNSATNDYTCTNNPPPSGGATLSFNQNVEQCGENAEGCNAYIRTDNVGANVLLNSDFEQIGNVPSGSYDNIRDSGVPDEFTQWFDGGGAGSCGLTPQSVTDSFGGFSAVQLSTDAGSCGASNPGTPIEDGFYILQSIDTGWNTNQRTFTVSFYAKTADGDTDCSGTNGRVNVDLMRIVSSSPTVVESNPAVSITPTSSWTRYTGSATFADATLVAQDLLFPVIYRPAGDACDVVIDDIQLEEGGLTNYKTYQQSTATHLKKAPAYLGCTADLASNNPACNNFALACTESEIGCEAYTSVSTGRTITGVVSNPRTCDPNVPGSCDQCPAEFVGCQAFRELPIERPPYRPARDPVSFVSTTGLSCPASSVGCEEYTNLEEVALGGEGKEYYSFVRMCVEDNDPDARAYYTWEGSSEFGFQLRQYDLKKSNTGDAPCTNIGAENDPIIQAQLGLNWPSCLDGFSVDRDGDGTNEESYAAATCTAADVGINPDCTEFYDNGGNLFYVLKSRLIYASDECKSYRNTNDGPDMIYHMVPGEGTSCQAVYAGCRAYKGNAGDNTRQLYVEDFESGTVGSWIGSASYSNESTNAAGHSMLVSNSAAINQAGNTLGFGSDKTYTISFWARSAVNASTNVTVSFGSAPPLTFPGQVAASPNDWQRFEIGPLYVPVSTDLSTAQLVIFSDNAFYIDNITITEVFENIYLVQDSYTECSGYEGCDRYADRDGNSHYLKSFTRLCDEQKVGCEAMIDTFNSDSPYATTHNIERYLRGDMNNDSRINQEDVDLLVSGSYALPAGVGDVNNDGVTDVVDETFLSTFVNSAGPAPSPTNYFVTSTVREDAVSFVVNDSAKSCNAASQGCSRFGKPVIDDSDIVQAFEHTYLIDDPDSYVTDLCTFGESSCREYTSPGGATYYFKDPGNQTCEFKRVTGQSAAGWYKKNTISGAPDCPSAIGYCSGGSNDGDACNSSDDCDSGFCNAHPNVVSQPVDGWVGSCPVSATGCTEYRDPEEVLLSSGDTASANYAVNASFESFSSAANASWVTDGVIDTDFPDVFDFWPNTSTVAGTCTTASAIPITCNTDANCPGADTCDTTGGRAACGMRTHAVSDAFLGDVAMSLRSYDVCGKSVNSSNVYSCVDATSRAVVAGSGAIVPLTGLAGCTSDAECPLANSYCQGDQALYSWYNFDTGAVTDNRAITVSFSAKLDPTDTDCNPTGVNDDIFFGLVRVIDNRTAPDGQQDYRPGHTFDVTAGWSKFEGTTIFDSVDASNWYNVSGPVEDVQNRISMVIRREADVVGMCDVIVDNFRITESLTSIDYVPYYFIEDTVDTTTCNGLVDREEGCRLFNDTSTSNVPWSSVDTADGETPALCTDPADCDANTVINVRKDRECKRWLDCETSIQQVNENGTVEELCLSRFICEKLDPLTGTCTSVGTYENVNQTFSTPAFADKIKNYTGLSLVGLDWDKRCENDPNISCTSDANCGFGGKCSDPQIYQGSLVVPAMSELGSISINGDLIEDGDFGDSDYGLNQLLTCPLTGGALADCLATGYTTPTNTIPLFNFSSKWSARSWFPGTSTAFWTEEDDATGQIPSQNSNLDENNVVFVQTNTNDADAQANGITYDLGRNIILDNEYYLSFRMRWGTPPSINDRVRVEFGYADFTGTEFEWTNIAPDFVPTHDWQEYILGPIKGGYKEDGTPVATYDTTRLNIIHIDVSGSGQVPPVEFYIDDVSLRPVLATKESGTGLLDRDCRLYPKSDSPSCVYTDENNTTYKGWQGYCLDRDPQNSKYCISWWPVDILKGESNVFGSLFTAGYTGRRPLYECVESAGNYDPSIISSGLVFEQTTAADKYNVCTCSPHCSDDPDNGNGRLLNSSPLLSQESGYRQFVRSNSNYDQFVNGEKCDELGDFEDWGNGIKFTWPGLIAAEDCGNGSGCGMGTSQSITWNANERLYKWEIDKIVVMAQATSHDNWWPTNSAATNSPEYNDNATTGNGWEGSIVRSKAARSTPDGDAYMIFLPDEADSHPANFNPNCWSQTWGTNGNLQGSNLLTVSICFDPVTQQITPTGSWYWWDTDSGGGMAASIIFYKKEQCTQLAEVVTLDDDVAWTQRIDGVSTYSALPDVLYRYAQNFAPFGSVVAPTGTPSSWSFNIRRGPVEVERAASVTASAGTSFSFAQPNNSDGRICSVFVTGAGYGTQNVCRNEADADKCFTAGGTCIGVGDGFCRDDAARYCTVATAPVDCVDLADTTCVTGAAGTAPGNWTAGVERLKRLFANVYRTWGWNPGTGSYSTSEGTAQTILTNWQNDYQSMQICSTSNRPDYDPTIPVTRGDYCGILPVVKNILIGAGGQPQQTSNVSIPNGGIIQLTFTVDADPNQKPIKIIEVDFDDDGVADYSTVGNYDNGNVFVTHEYTQPSFGYTPRIRIVDNWDWCGILETDGPGCPYGDCRYPAAEAVPTACEWIDTGITIEVTR